MHLPVQVSSTLTRGVQRGPNAHASLTRCPLRPRASAQLLLLRAHESADALTAIVTFFAFAFHSVPTPLCTLSKRLSRRSQRQLYANRRLRRLRSSKEVSARCAIRTCTFWGYSVQTCFCNSRAYSKTSTSEHLLHRYISVLLR
eukprot:4847257-Pleurochrysis_carterae.AAC.1